MSAVLSWVKNTPVLYFNSQNQLVAYDGVIKDITAIREYAQKLLEIHAAVSGLNERRQEIFNHIRQMNDELSKPYLNAQELGLTESAMAQVRSHLETLLHETDRISKPAKKSFFSSFKNAFWPSDKELRTRKFANAALLGIKFGGFFTLVTALLTIAPKAVGVLKLLTTGTALMPAILASLKLVFSASTLSAVSACIRSHIRVIRG
ncbi:MAG: hypothetical protein UX60_C0019G0001, partial [Berkelbacteria bacterium GW2011_GWA2_46_7]